MRIRIRISTQLSGERLGEPVEGEFGPTFTPPKFAVGDKVKIIKDGSHIKVRGRSLHVALRLMLKFSSIHRRYFPLDAHLHAPMLTSHC